MRLPARRALAVAFTVSLLVAACGSAGAASDATARSRSRPRGDLQAYEGLGTWVDVFDYVPAYQSDGSPPVTTGAFHDMARLGVKTVYLQGAQVDARSPGDTVDGKLLGRFLRAGHEAGLRVVAWYAPVFDDVNADVRRVRALLDFRSGGEGFDGLALDLERKDGVPDVGQRNTALVDLSRRVRKVAGDRPIGAIVLEPLLLEVVNTRFWPEFPWRKLASLYDVWLPMSYWTNRSADSGYRDGFVYTDENVKRLRADLHEKDAPVHVIGGVADSARARDYDGFVKAARKRDAIGWSVYDFNATPSSAWPHIRG